MVSKFIPIWYVKGVFDSDGYIQSHYGKSKGVALEVKDHDFALRFLENIKLYSSNKARIWRVNGRDLWKVRVYDVLFTRRLIRMGLPSDESDVYSYLSGVIDGDGHLKQKKYGEKWKRELKISSSDQGYLRDIANILSGFGINSYIRMSIKPNTKNRYGKRALYDWSISDRANLMKILPNLRLIYRKQKVADEIMAFFYAKITEKDKICYDLRCKGLSYQKIAHKIQVTHRETARFHYNKYLRYTDEFKNGA